MSSRIDLSNKRFGRLLVLEEAGRKGNHVAWLCLCDCGNRKVIDGTKLRSGNTRSCRCLDTELTARRSTKHGLSNKESVPEYFVWKTMRQRCTNPVNKGYPNYGGRGIKICARWDDFSHFLQDMGPRPSPRHSLDRIDVNGDYEPLNCRWATQLEQANNKRNNHRLTYLGETKTIPEWAREVGISPTTIRARLTRYKWPISDALTRGVR